MTEQFEQFIKERQFISNVSPRTVEWYRQSLAWLDNPEPTQDELKSLVISMREHGLKPASCNNRIRALNAYLHWKTEGISKCGAGFHAAAKTSSSLCPHKSSSPTNFVL